MSKANIRNINNLGVFKSPVITYSGDQFTDLLFILKKKSFWSLTTNRHVYKTVNARAGDYSLRVYYNINYLNKIYKKEPLILKTNPFSTTSYKTREVFFWSKVTYTT